MAQPTDPANTPSSSANLASNAALAVIGGGAGAGIAILAGNDSATTVIGGGVGVGLAVLVRVFLWVVNRMDRLHAEGERLHKEWLAEEKQLRRDDAQAAQLARTADANRAGLERERYDAEITRLRDSLEGLRHELVLCRQECQDCRRREAALAARVAVLEGLQQQQSRAIQADVDVHLSKEDQEELPP